MEKFNQINESTKSAEAIVKYDEFKDKHNVKYVIKQNDVFTTNKSADVGETGVVGGYGKTANGKHVAGIEHAVGDNVIIYDVVGKKSYVKVAKITKVTVMAPYAADEGNKTVTDGYEIEYKVKTNSWVKDKWSDVVGSKNFQKGIYKV